jgi:hypothetical protein
MDAQTDTYTLHVPLIGQRIAGPVPFLKGLNACWYASACMVAYYHEVGPRPGLPDVWASDLALDSEKICELAKAEGLKAVPRPEGELDGEAWIKLLKAYGPIWAAGKFGQFGGGHAIVITGVVEGMVVYNDPWEPMVKKVPAISIACKLLERPNALLAKGGVRKVRS